MALTDQIKTRVLILSDTHGRSPKSETETSYAYQWPLPEADVAVHTGDLTLTGKHYEHENAISLLKNLRADLKIVIPGNHDLTLDTTYYAKHGHIYGPRPKYGDSELQAIRDLYTGPDAQAANIVYLEEGVRTIQLRSGALLTIYASAYTPEFCGWAFAYPRSEDRFNRVETADPVPSYRDNPGMGSRNIDVMLTHGPPFGVLDQVRGGSNVGCEHLLDAVSRARPLVHCFGHIHEAWGGVLKQWPLPGANSRSQLSNTSLDMPSGRSHTAVDEEPLTTDDSKIKKNMAQYVDITNMAKGSKTLFINSSIMNLGYEPEQAPWIVDLMLDRAV